MPKKPEGDHFYLGPANAPKPESGIEDARAFKRVIDEKYAEKMSDESAPLFDPENPDPKPVYHGEMHFIAHDILPCRRLVTAVIDALPELSLMAVATAGILYDGCFGKMNPGDIDRLMVAALITSDPDILEVCRIPAPEDTADLARGLVHFAKTGVMAEGANDMQRLLCEAYLAAKLEVIDKALITKTAITEKPEQMIDYAQSLQKICDGKNSSAADKIARRAVNAFNKVALRLELNAELTRTETGRLGLSTRY